MISDIKVELSLLKEILLDVIEQNRNLICAQEDKMLQTLYEGYFPKNDIDITHLEYYRRYFADFYARKCKNIAVFCSEDKNNFNHKQVAMLEKEGKVFTCSILHVLKRQLYFEMRLRHEDYQLAISVITKLCNFLSYSYYFDTDKIKLKQLFENALLCYLSNKETFDLKDAEIISVVKSMKSLLQLQTLEYEIECGEIYFSDSSGRDIQSKIEKLISNVGGNDFLRFLFDEKIKPQYNKTVDRYLIHRNMRQSVRNINEMRIPYNYLIQLAIKHVDKAEHILLTHKGQKNEFDKAIELGSNYLNVMNLQPYSVIKDICYDYKNIPVKLSRNILFEKMFTPIQYRPEFVDEFIQTVYVPFFNDNLDVGYTCNEFVSFYRFLLYEKDICVLYTFEELREKTKIRKAALKNLLSDFSVPCEQVNSQFDNFLAETNYRRKPLVRLKSGKYFLFSAYFNGIAIAETLYFRLKPYYPGKFNRIKGEYVEKMIKNLFLEKGYQFNSGEYMDGQKTKYECDMILESDKQIVFIEIKNQPLPESFELGDDVETLRCLGEGMIKAQMQCYRHIYNLKKQGQLTINKSDGSSYVIKENERRIVCVSLCTQEYLFLTNKVFSSGFLQSLLVSTYHATVPDKESRLNKFNSLRNEFVSLIHDIYGTGDLQKVFFPTLFRSAQQIYTILNATKSMDEFIDYLTRAINIADVSLDVYCQFVNDLKMDNKNYR